MELFPQIVSLKFIVKDIDTQCLVHLWADEVKANHLDQIVDAESFNLLQCPKEHETEHKGPHAKRKCADRLSAEEVCPASVQKSLVAVEKPSRNDWPTAARAVDLTDVYRVVDLVADHMLLN